MFLRPLLTHLINTQAISLFGQSVWGAGMLCACWCDAALHHPVPCTGEDSATQECELRVPPALAVGGWREARRVFVSAGRIFTHYAVSLLHMRGVERSLFAALGLPALLPALMGSSGFARCSASYIVGVGFFQRRSR